MGKNENIHSGLVWYKRIALEIVWGLCFVIGCSPRWFRFGVLLPFFSFLLRAVRYRKSTVIENLTKSFPEKSEAEIRDIARRFYDTLAEVVVTTLSLSATTPERYGKVLEWHDPQGHIERTRGRDWVATAAHYGCWEYYPLWSWEDGDCRFMSVYHTLKSEVFEHLYRRLRSRLAKNIAIVPMQDLLGLGKEARMNTPSVLGNNWTWRVTEDAFTKELAEKLKTMSVKCGRLEE